MEDIFGYFSDNHFIDYYSQSYAPSQMGSHIHVIKSLEQIEDCDIIIIGCGDDRGAGIKMTSHAPDQIRQYFYQLHYWHDSVRIGDLGNLILGNSQHQTYRAIAYVLSHLIALNKKVIILGGSHDLTLGQAKAYQQLERLTHLTCIDSEINLKEEEEFSDEGFLMDVLTAPNNFIKHFTHIGFQTYYNPSDVLQTLDSLRFDCYRLGVVRHNLEIVEPDLRSTHALSIDLNALRYTEASYIKKAQPNGFKNDEMCQLIRYAAMSNDISSMGIYGYQMDKDEDEAGAEAIAQMLWYFIDGVFAQKFELDFDQIDLYEQRIVKCSGMDILFLKSPKTNRWWFETADKNLVPCSEEDFKTASHNEIPERWLRIQERLS